MLFFNKEKYSDIADLLYVAGTIGLHMVSGTFVGFGLGWVMDHYAKKWFDWNTWPWLTMGMLAIGIAAGFRNVYLDAKRFQRRETRDKGPEADDSRRDQD